MKLTAQARALGFVIVVCASLLGLQAWSVWGAFNSQMSEAATAAGNMRRAVIQHADDTLRAADVVLDDIVERIETDGLEPPEMARLQKILQSHYARLRQLNGILIYDEHGNWIATSMDRLPPNVNNSDREYFKFHQSHTDSDTHIGDPVVSRSTKRWIIPLSRRISDRNGKFAGVAVTTIEMDYFTTFYEKFNIGQQGAILLTSSNGTLLTRVPFDPKTVGSDASKGAVFTALKRGGPDTVMLRSKIDNVIRLYSFDRSHNYPLVVSAALAKDEVLSPWLEETIKSSAIVLLLISMLGVSGYRLARQISVREHAEVALNAAKKKLLDANASLELLSMEDSLTGLGNRRQFDLILANEYRKALLDQTSIALIMIDVDYFKTYNDTYGHPVGDACLVKLANVFKRVRTGTRDVAMRYGGEEFAVVLPGTDKAGAYIAAERIRLEIELLALPHAGHPSGFVTVSLGMSAFVPKDGANSANELLATADKALYAAKTQGRNCVRAIPAFC